MIEKMNPSRNDIRCSSSSSSSLAVRIKYMKEEKKNAGTPGSDSWVVVHEPNIPWGAAGSEDELGVAFGALCCVLVERGD